MTIKIYNSLGSTKQEFIPLNPPKVKMYTCGVTVYDSCHIGHARSLYVFEVIRRYLKFRGFEVEFIRNITDVDDKIINKAREWAKKEKISVKEAFEKVRVFYIKDYYKDLECLNIPKADIEPLATENIKQIQDYIAELIEKGFAYEKGGNVYFSPRKLENYGSLSGNTIDDVQEGDRIGQDPFKKNPVDFALWKKIKEDEPYWGSPWGPGRPGWHIECSVMSQRYLKTDTLDIHGGGRDLIFPHHENEKAQAEARTGKKFANFWIHHGLLTINGQKMAKSLGNFVTIKDVLAKYPADVLKIFFLQAHYSSPVDFTWEKMEEAKKAHERILILLDKLEKNYANKDETKTISSGNQEEMAGFYQQFIESMDDDFNTPKGLAVLFDIVTRCNKLLESDEKHKDKMLRDAFEKIKKIANVFGLSLLKQTSKVLSDEVIEQKINLRTKFKQEKDFKSADAIRDELLSLGVILEDSKDGKTTWRIHQ